MDPVDYYSTTLTNAAKNLGPWILFGPIAYLIFMRLPFWLLLRGLKSSKLEEEVGEQNIAQESKKREETFSLDEKTYEERLAKARKEKEQNQKRWHEEKKQEHKQKPSNKKIFHKASAAEILFEIDPHRPLSQAELKKRYHELLKQNHPDKVAALGVDFKKLAEKKTKEINSAYQELKKKAS